MNTKNRQRAALFAVAAFCAAAVVMATAVPASAANPPEYANIPPGFAVTVSGDVQAIGVDANGNPLAVPAAAFGTSATPPGLVSSAESGSWAAATSSRSDGTNGLTPKSIIGTVTVRGYPGDKAFGTMWTMSGSIESSAPNQLCYSIDTVGGQSGSPVYTSANHVIAIHAYGTGGGTACSTLNSGTRITEGLYNLILSVAW